MVILKQGSVEPAVLEHVYGFVMAGYKMFVNAYG